MELSNAVWRQSARSKEDGSNCVQVAKVSGLVAIRDSKDADGAVITVSRGDFNRFAEVLKAL
ncbi:DUF397 domain-containing protein [Actinomadura sp. WMMB 499]|uniref:DUF397 domain-containing protein n=1 Tax=Actinomadura sp. WMMB 499 TaxID=1219491 RepID=UPI0012487BF3|nr:DUF397 domain-containing protein [Actinomadura sp. WMMB 499]QFG22073.1 DUF397 domain-containing protein [Actinomadura sp. WMMB 499]